MIGIIFGIVIIIALILGVYIIGAYTANRDNDNIDTEIKNVSIQIFYYVILSFIIVFGFMFLFERIGFKKEEIGIAVAIIVVFTSIFCTNKIIAEIKKFKGSKE